MRWKACSVNGMESVKIEGCLFTLQLAAFFLKLEGLLN